MRNIGLGDMFKEEGTPWPETEDVSQCPFLNEFGQFSKASFRRLGKDWQRCRLDFREQFLFAGWAFAEIEPTACALQGCLHIIKHMQAP